MDLTDKIDGYMKKGIEKDVLSLLEIAMFMEESEYMLDEAVKDWGKKVGGLLKKVGLHAHSGEGGLIWTLGKSSAVMGQLFWNLMKAFTGDKKAREKVIEIANTEITKEQVIDFLLRLDTLTLHAVTGPIHMLDALTGWHIGTNIRKASEPVVKRTKEAIQHLRNLADNLRGKMKKQVLDYVYGLRRILGEEPSK